MKIGITCYPTYGGSGVVATELGIELAQRGHQVHFITYSPPFRLTGAQPNIWYHEVEVSHYPLFDYPPYDLALATRMALRHSWGLGVTAVLIHALLDFPMHKPAIAALVFVMAGVLAAASLEDVQRRTLPRGTP